jgi:hypothetical protein
MEETDGTAPESFFGTVVHHLTNGDLKDYASAWQGNETGFSLKQLAGILYPYEVARAEKAGLKSVKVMFSLFIIVFVAAGIVVASYTNLGLEGGVATTISGMILVGVIGGIYESYIESAEFKSGNGPVYKMELRRFSDVLEAALAALDVDLNGLLMMGRNKTKQLATDRLTIWAAEIERLERERDSADTVMEAQAKGVERLEFRALFDARYETFRALGLESRGYGAVFADARTVTLEKCAA